jgi:hypothetical protein
MKTVQGMFITLSIAVLFMFTAQPAAAGRGSEGTGGTVFDGWVDPHARGLKVDATLAVYYEVLCDYENPPEGGCPACYGADFPVKMDFVLTLKKCNDLKVFIGDSGDAAICFVLTEFDEQKAFIDDFIRNTVLPALFPHAAEFAYKSITNVVETDRPPFYLTMDIELAVHYERHWRH